MPYRVRTAGSSKRTASITSRRRLPRCAITSRHQGLTFRRPGGSAHWAITACTCCSTCLRIFASRLLRSIFPSSPRFFYPGYPGANSAIYDSTSSASPPGGGGGTRAASPRRRLPAPCQRCTRQPATSGSGSAGNATRRPSRAGGDRTMTSPCNRRPTQPSPATSRMFGSATPA